MGSSHTITGAEGAWAGDIACVAEHFVPKGAILGGYIRGQYPSHWVATKRSDREVDVHGVVTLKVEGGGTYTAHVHEYLKFWEPCVQINRHFWKLEYLEAEYYPTHWYHKEKAICDPNWNFGKTPVDGYKGFSWHLFGTIKKRLFVIPTGILEKHLLMVTRASPGICLVPLAIRALMPMATVLAVDTVSITGARVEKAGENMVCLI